MTDMACEDCIDFPEPGSPCPNIACINDHTPFPWYQQGQYIMDANGQIIASFQEREEAKPAIGGYVRDSNVAFVMRACEQFHDLVDALTYATSILDSMDEETTERLQDTLDEEIDWKRLIFSVRGKGDNDG